MHFKRIHVVVVLGLAVAATVAYGAIDNRREPVEFFRGHTHHDGFTIGAPQHSGGTDKYGCHNASVPYHCH